MSLAVLPMDVEKIRTYTTSFDMKKASAHQKKLKNSALSDKFNVKIVWDSSVAEIKKYLGLGK